MAIGFSDINPVSSVLGIGGLASNLITNHQNQKNFEQQQRNWREQMDFSKYQYEDSKVFNSAAEQVQRLRAAGMNPAFMFGQNAGQAVGQSQPSQGGLPTQTPLDMNGLSALSSSVNLTNAQKENLDANTRDADAGAKLKEVDALTRSEENLARIYNMNADSWYKDKLSDSVKWDIDFQRETIRYRIQQERYRMELEDAQVVAADIALQYQVPETAARINELVARMKANLATGRASLQQASAALRQAFTSENIAKSMYGMNDKQRSQYFKASLKLMEDTAFKAKMEGKYRKWDVENPLKSRFGVAAAKILDDFVEIGSDVYNAKQGVKASGARRPAQHVHYHNR